MALPMTKIIGRLPLWQFLARRSARNLCSKSDSVPLNEDLLKVLVCPLTKKPLRYDSTTNELFSDDIGVAYPIKNGIPNLVPQDGRMLKESAGKNKDSPT